MGAQIEAGVFYPYAVLLLRVAGNTTIGTINGGCNDLALGPRAPTSCSGASAQTR